MVASPHPTVPTDLAFLRLSSARHFDVSMWIESNRIESNRSSSSSKVVRAPNNKTVKTTTLFLHRQQQPLSLSLYYTRLLLTSDRCLFLSQREKKRDRDVSRVRSSSSRSQHDETPQKVNTRIGDDDEKEKEEDETTPTAADSTLVVRPCSRVRRGCRHRLVSPFTH